VRSGGFINGRKLGSIEGVLGGLGGSVGMVKDRRGRNSENISRGGMEE
jgi:hypothetical protein